MGAVGPAARLCPTSLLGRGTAAPTRSGAWRCLSVIAVTFFKVFVLAVYLNKIWLRCLADFRQDNSLSDSAKCISEYANLLWQNPKVGFELLSCVML